MRDTKVHGSGTFLTPPRARLPIGDYPPRPIGGGYSQDGGGGARARPMSGGHSQEGGPKARPMGGGHSQEGGPKVGPMGQGDRKGVRYILEIRALLGQGGTLP